jgi:sporulation protein YlmC with PRC-barrel domain
VRGESLAILPIMSFSIEDLRGRAVISSDGRVLGEIATLLLDGSGGLCVETVRVKLRKDMADELGIERGTFRAATIDVPVRAIQSVTDTVVLSVAVSDLRRAPGPRLETPQPVH